MRQELLFYSFIVIFILTALVTLLGVVGVVTIPALQLNMLLGAFLVELAGAVVALYNRTDFFAPPSNNLATSLGSAIEAFDQISDEIAATIKNMLPDANHVHRFLIRRTRDGVVAYERMKVITADQLEQLPKEQKRLIRDYERAMATLRREWSRLKRSDADTQIDPATRERNLALLRGMKDNLIGVLKCLEDNGIYLDDHYDEVRTLVATL